MIDYDSIYVLIIDYLGKNFDVSYADAALHSEAITEIVKEAIETEISNAE